MLKNMKKLTSGVLMLTMVLCGCSTSQSSTNQTTSNHPVITMTTRSTSDYSDFIEALHEEYPEINIEPISYKGANTTEYSNVQLKAHDVSDIFVVSYPPVEELQKENLLDLSGEDFISEINLKTVSDLTVDGAVYLLPTRMSLFGAYYNKTLFEKHGWEVPNSLEELEAMIPEIEAAGVKLSECNTQYMGATFSYFFDTNAPEYFTELDGISWMSKYLSGEATAKGNLEECMEKFQHLIDIGLLNVGDTPTSDADTVARFKEGNTAFLISNSALTFTQNEDGSGDEYAIMPYLSDDGSNNTIITNMGMYIGVSKDVANDEAKYNDVMKVMEFVASPKGQETLINNTNTVSPLKGDSVEEDSPLYEMSKLVDDGKYMSLIYSGWENYVVGIGESAYAMMKGEMSGDEFITYMDDLQKEVLEEGGLPAICKVEEDLDKQQVAKLVGAAFAEGTDADCALISIGDYHGSGMENERGINAKIYKDVTMDTNVVSTFNPLGATATIKLMTLTGKQIKEWAKEGYFVSDDPTPFEYVLITKDDEELDDDTTYTVACASESEERGEIGKIKESDVVSQDAIIDYLKQIKTINSETINWK